MAASRSPRSAALKKLAFALGYGGLVLAVPLLALLFFQQRFVTSLRRPGIEHLPRHENRYVTRGLVNRVGFFHNAKRSSYLHFPRNKTPDRQRVCALGDSFTLGDEVGRQHDYPTLLGDLLARGVTPRHEVLNFGSSWLGFHQTYLVWRELAHGFGCDTILLGPASFFPERDTTFNHAGLENPYYLHARYVLEGDGLRLVDVIGDSLEERFEQYHRPLPHLAYLRFDRQAPAILRALLPVIRSLGSRATTLRNPFYYRAESRHEEAEETYRRLLTALAEDGPEILLGHTTHRIVRLATELDRAKLRAFRVEVPHNFPYLAAKGHYGPLGNQLLARQFLGALTGIPEELSVLRSRPRLAPTPKSAMRTSAKAASFSSYPSLRVELAGRSLGHLVRGGSIADLAGSQRALFGSGVVSLLHFPQQLPKRPPELEPTPLDGCLFPLSHGLRDGEPLTLRRVGAADARPLGHVRLLDPRLPLGSVEFRDLRIVNQPTWPRAEQLVLLGPSAATLGADSAFEILLDGAPILTGRAATHRALLARTRRVGGSCWQFRANASGFVEVENLPAAGSYQLVLAQPGGGELRVDIASWRRVPLASSRARVQVVGPEQVSGL